MIKFGQKPEAPKIDAYPGYGYAWDGGWRIFVSGIAYQDAGELNVRERMVLRLLRNAMNVTEEETLNQTFRHRVAPFFIDAERKCSIRVVLGGQEFPLRKLTRRNGRFRSWLNLPKSLVETHSASDEFGNRILSIDIVSDHPKSEPVATSVFLLENEGVCVVSDIDDTIKVSGVADRRELLANTFLREFRCVEGMADVYRKWAARGADFHYVSSSPWQLFDPLHQLRSNGGFPAGTMHLRNFRLRDQFIRKMLLIRQKGKATAIRTLVKHLANRQFVLIGDSGEKDPEIYRKISHQFTGRIAGIFIRELEERPLEAERMDKVRRSLTSGTVARFRSASELEQLASGIFNGK